MNYELMLLQSLRTVVIPDSDNEPVSEQDFIDAMNLNSTLLNLGYTFAPKDLIAIARTHSCDRVLDILAEDKKLSKARAMYKASEAATIDTATYRIHQLLHYFSTYGLEFLFGQQVEHGWMPHELDEAGVEDDERIRDAVVLETITETQKYLMPYTHIISRRNRATHLERDILAEAVRHLDSEQLQSVNIPFKENLYDIFGLLIDSGRREEIPELCAHSGDALKSAYEYLVNKDFHLTTSQKKAVVKVLESFPVEDFRENLMPSNQSREKNLLVLQFTDYNRYSRSPEHREAVRALRNDELQSWNGKEAAMMKKDLTEALDFAGQRPGMLLRQMNWFLKLGVKPEDMLTQLRRSAGKLSLQTLMEIINAFGRKNERQTDHRDDLIRITRQLINDRLQLLKTPLADKKVYIERGVYDFAHSEVQFNSRSDESTYIVSGLAFRIPEEARYIRNFVYWEKAIDGERVDVDAHFYMLNRDGSRSHVGWNDEHRANGVYMSGDVTHSSPYGCEFIDLDLENENVGGAIVHIHSYTGQPFKNITNFRVAITAVSKLGVRDNKKLYTGSNSFFIHELRSNDTAINYGYINAPQRYLKFVGKTGGSIYNEEDIDFDSSVPYSLNDYLADLLKWQNCTEVSDPSDADVILRLDKPASDKDISLIDVNYFADSEVSAE